MQSFANVAPSPAPAPAPPPAPSPGRPPFDFVQCFNDCLAENGVSAAAIGAIGTLCGLTTGAFPVAAGACAIGAGLAGIGIVEACVFRCGLLGVGLMAGTGEGVTIDIGFGSGGPGAQAASPALVALSRHLSAGGRPVSPSHLSQMIAQSTALSRQLSAHGVSATPAQLLQLHLRRRCR